MERLDHKTNKQQYTIELVRRIGSHLIKKLKKALRKHLAIQLNLLGQEKREAVELNDNFIVNSVSHRERDYKSIRPYNQLKSLAREEKHNGNSQPQKIFDILVVLS